MKRIMLDPGHAGAYYNASPVVEGYYESKVMWSLSQKLGAALTDRGFEVGFTRERIDEDPELTERGRRAVGYDLFLSIHSNASTLEDVDAPWLIHLAGDADTSIDEASVKAAVALGKVISPLMGVASAQYHVKQTDFDRNGDGKLNDEWYGVLFGAKSVGVPAVIVEHSFHTNKRAAEWLLVENNLDKLAEAEADALALLYGMEVPMTADERMAFDALRAKVEKMERSLEDVRIKYDWTTACPEWARSTVHRLHQRGILKGDENGQLRLTEPMLRILVMLERAGVV